MTLGMGDSQPTADPAASTPAGRSLLRAASQHRVAIALVVMLALAFSLRVVKYLENPRPLAYAGLSAEQAEMARNILDHGKWFSLNGKAYELLKQRQADEGRMVDPSQVDFSRVDRQARAKPVVDQMPGIALVLTAIWGATGDKTYSSIQWLQILIDSAMVLLVYWITRRLTGRVRPALLAALLYAVWPTYVRFVRYPTLDAWAIWFTIACVAAFVWAREKPTSRRRLLLLGAITGVGIYFRPFVIFLPAALALVATPRGGWKEKLTWIAVPTVLALAILAPWTARNYHEFHRFIPTRTGLGQAVAEGTGATASDEQSKALVRHKKPGARYGTPGYDDLLLSTAARAIVDHPVRYLRLVARRAARYLLPCLLVLLAWRRWRRAALIPVAAVAATVIPYFFIGDAGGFYLPAFFAYFILLAMATDVVLAHLSRSRLVPHELLPRIRSRVQSQRHPRAVRR
jgi:hypothetical protein